VNRSVYLDLLREDAEDLYENAPCGYLSTDADGTILRMNQTFADLAGYRKEDLVGRRRFAELLTIGGRMYYETHLRPLLRMQGFVREIALDLTRADGGQVPIIVHAVERRAAADPSQLTIVRITAFDATDRRRYERELLRARQEAEEAARARSDLIGMISHDLRAPLSALVTATAILQRTELTAQQSRYVRVLHSSATQAMTLLTSTLSLSSLQAGRATVREQEFDPREIAQQAAAAATLAAAGKPEVRIEVSVSETVPARIISDPDKLTQVLTNLLGNAVKFTERGRVSLVVHPVAMTDTAVTLAWAVSDTGIGIAADRLPFIFDEFTQASEEIGNRYGGTGLGLAISRKLVRLLGSDLQVTSTPGEGSTFRFELTCQRPPDAGAPAIGS
jgi:PAS domain S-box-containing protein